MTIFKLPDLGEGLPDAEIVEWHVKEGDTIAIDQSLVSMETAKAVVEVPSPFAGRIKKLYGKSGDVILTGAPLVELESESNAASVTNAASTTNVDRSSEDSAPTVAGKLEVGNTVLKESPMGLSNRAPGGIKATPAVRALAQRLKVDISSVRPTGAHGTITTQDIEHAAAAHSEAGPLELFKGVRRSMAQVMIQSHNEVVPVTVVEDAKLIHWTSKQDITVRIIQAIIAACKQEPALNAWYDSKAMGRRLVSSLHLGLAQDTHDGLFVPVIHQAETLNATQLRQKIDELKKQVEDRHISLQDLRGATFTLSNFGKFAGRYANPIIVPPTVAILGVGRIRDEVVAVKGEVKICSVLPLALTIDHRAVTGGEATRFLGLVIKALEKDI
jgi:2-oxoisovalerate dehydrogenase E2 component (dihydrolipoyl transacylase)